MDKLTIGKHVKWLRKEKGYTQQELAESVEISINYLSNIETGKDLCSTKVLVAIANELDASVDFILGENLNINLKSPNNELMQNIKQHLLTLNDKGLEHLLKYLSIMKKEIQD